MIESLISVCAFTSTPSSTSGRLGEIANFSRLYPAGEDHRSESTLLGQPQRHSNTNNNLCGRGCEFKIVTARDLEEQNRDVETYEHGYGCGCSGDELGSFAQQAPLLQRHLGPKTTQHF